MTNELLKKLNQTRTEEERLSLLIQNYLQAFPEEISEAFRVAAVPHWFNKSILVALLSKPADIIEKIYQQLVELPFVQDFPGRGHNVYQSNRKVILSNMWRQERAKFINISKLASEYFSRHCRDKIEAQIEYFYHLVLVDSSQGAKEVNRVCAQWDNQFRFAELEFLLKILSEQVDEDRVTGSVKAVILYHQGKAALRLEQKQKVLDEILKTLRTAESEAHQDMELKAEIQQVIKNLPRYGVYPPSIKLEPVDVVLPQVPSYQIDVGEDLRQSKASPSSSKYIGTEFQANKTARSTKNRSANKSGVKKQKRNVPNGIAYIQSTFNNSIITITDQNGDAISWASAGSSGFKGAKKGTPFAAQTAAERAARRATDQGMRQVEVMVSGPGAGRETAVRALQGAGLEITLIRDITPIPHNGCRPPKRRRV